MGATQTYDEKALVSQLATGDDNAFGQLFRQYRASVKTFVQRFVKSPELAEDLCQEVFMKIWEKHEQLTGVESLRSYLFVTARNHTLNFLRKASNQPVAIGEILKHQSGDNSLHAVLDKEYRHFINEVLASLPAQTRQVFKMCREQDMSYDEIAERLGISRNTVKKHMMRSNKTFRDALDKDMGLGLLILLCLMVHD